MKLEIQTRKWCNICGPKSWLTVAPGDSNDRNVIRSCFLASLPLSSWLPPIVGPRHHLHSICIELFGLSPPSTYTDLHFTPAMETFLHYSPITSPNRQHISAPSSRWRAIRSSRSSRTACCRRLNSSGRVEEVEGNKIKEVSHLSNCCN